MQFRIRNRLTLSLLTEDELIKKLEAVIRSKTFCHIVVLDIRLFIKSFFSKALKKSLQGAHIVLPKGRLFVWGLRSMFLTRSQFLHMYKRNPLIKSTSNLFPLEKARKAYKKRLVHKGNLHLSIIFIQRLLYGKTSFFFLGGVPSDSSFIYKYVKQSFPLAKILAVHSRGQIKKEPMAVLEKIKKVEPSVLIADIGVGWQEKWINKNKAFLSKSVCIGLQKEVSFLAGRENNLSFFEKRFVFYPLFALYYLTVVFFYKTILRGELEWVE